jgi:ABC-type transport system involved in multi-copper enzyme maturation permease subunit
MTTALPSWAYLWGRYLAGLLICLGMACLYLAATLGMGVFLHLTISAYPLPPLNAVFLYWIGMVLPATFLVSSLAFALSTLFPHLSNLVKIIIIGAWIVGAVIIPMSMRGSTPPEWYVNWDPTSAITALGLQSAYSLELASVQNNAQLQEVLLTTENTAPGMAGWFLPHLILALASLLLIGGTMFLFKRFRNIFN